MPTLTRKRVHDRPESWHIHYAACASARLPSGQASRPLLQIGGNGPADSIPAATCGSTGTARRGVSKQHAWRLKPGGVTICQNTAKPIFRNAAITWHGALKNAAGSIVASRCPTIGGRVPDRGWKRTFDEPIKLPDGRKLRTLQDAIAWLAKEIPPAEHEMKQVQAAAHCVTEAAENGGPMIFARMGMLQAIHRHRGREFSSGKTMQWGKRKLKRDE